MCNLLYLGTDQLLPIRRFDTENPGFFVGPIESDEDREACKFLSKQHKYYLGSHSQCGCGFSISYGVDHNTREQVANEETEDSRQSLAALKQLLEQLLRLENDVELFATWSGEVKRGFETRADWTLKDFEDPWFELPETLLIRVRRV